MVNKVNILHINKILLFLIFLKMKIKHYKNQFLDRDGTLIKAIKKSKTKYRPPYSKKELKLFKR